VTLPRALGASARDGLLALALAASACQGRITSGGVLGATPTYPPNAAS
jgi:hypothetical protein